MMFYKVVLTFLVIAALSVNVLAAPTFLNPGAPEFIPKHKTEDNEWRSIAGRIESVRADQQQKLVDMQKKRLEDMKADRKKQQEELERQKKRPEDVKAERKKQLSQQARPPSQANQPSK